MSRIKNIKNENVINIHDIMSLFVFEQKPKYAETLLRIMKNTQNLGDYVGEIKKHFQSVFGITENMLSGFNDLQLVLIYRFVDSMFNIDDLEKFQKFCRYNERNLIDENDLSKYKTFDQITKSVEIADLIVNEKEMEKQIKVLYKDDEWLMLRPLTFESSKKYGSNTKWCTTFTDQSYFTKYSTRGILIYTINKKTGYKVASYYSLNKDDFEFSFWNQLDQRIDSLDAEIPQELLKIISDERRSIKTNYDLYKGKEKISKSHELKDSEYDVRNVGMTYLSTFTDNNRRLIGINGIATTNEEGMNEMDEIEFTPYDTSVPNPFTTDTYTGIVSGIGTSNSNTIYNDSQSVIGYDIFTDPSSTI